MSLRKTLSIMLLSAFFLACKEKKVVSPPKPGEPTIIVRKDTARLKKEPAPSRSPIINIVDTIAPKYGIIYIKDTAHSSQRISEKLAKIYDIRLAKVITDHKLTIEGPRMAWYRSNKSPFSFEAGIPVNKKPGKLPKGVLFKTVGGEPAYIAHFYGPYSHTFVAYEVLTEWLKDHKKTRSALPYEIYVTNPVAADGKMMDPYKVLTNIVFPYK
jgi:hypothetical protein